MVIEAEEDDEGKEDDDDDDEEEAMCWACCTNWNTNIPIAVTSGTVYTSPLAADDDDDEVEEEEEEEEEDKSSDTHIRVAGCPSPTTSCSNVGRCVSWATAGLSS